MGFMLSTSYGLGLVVPVDLTDEDEGYGLWAEEALKEFSMLSYELPYAYDYWDEYLAVYIQPTVQQFFGARAHKIEQLNFDVDDFALGLRQLEEFAEKYNQKFEPQWLLTTMVG